MERFEYIIIALVLCVVALTAISVLSNCDTSCEMEKRLAFYYDCIEDGRPEDICLAVIGWEGE